MTVVYILLTLSNIFISGCYVVECKKHDKTKKRLREVETAAGKLLDWVRKNHQ